MSSQGKKRSDFVVGQIDRDPVEDPTPWAGYHQPKALLVANGLNVIGPKNKPNSFRVGPVPVKSNWAEDQEPTRSL